MPAPIYDYTEARKALSSILDASARGGASIISRAHDAAAVVDAGRLRGYLSRTIESHAVTVHEDGAWAILLPGIPVAAEAAALDDAVADCVAALREYAADWEDHLSKTPNHAGSWALV
ncbi:hypothetical protein [Sinomonas sp. RB5]